MNPRAWLYDRRFWLAAAAIAAFAALRLLGVGDYLTFDTIRLYRQDLTAFVAEHTLLAALTYLAVYVVAVSFSVPGAAVLTIAGGFLFGALAGGALSVVAATTGATLVFLFARVIFGEDALERFGAPAKALAEAIRENAAPYLLVLRLVPIFPFFLVNLIPAFAGVSTLTYVLTTFFGIMPGTVVFALAGGGLGGIIDRGEEISIGSVLTPEIVAGLVGLALLSLLAIPLKKRFGRQPVAARPVDEV
ncbi:MULTISPECIES: TVP38/TMEM64 family protein [Rhodomicrobium]|uniref:TVP38/TMEM64 family protein n=1 Tax=Rhodomicrobium TaxID=1068 RepID=UPI001483B9AC|nr:MULTISPECIES: TVP38/TMEM64 family protein [Rhodomicrobium]